MTKLENYNNDGANYQAQAVLAMLKGHGNIESSWNDQHKTYFADILVSRWQNCREQGYVLCLKGSGYTRQLNVAFFEHRNSDSICAIKWEQSTINAPTIDSAEFGDVYKDKWDVSKSVGYGKVNEMADWIFNELTKFWEETEKNSVKKEKSVK